MALIETKTLELTRMSLWKLTPSHYFTLAAEYWPGHMLHGGKEWRSTRRCGRTMYDMGNGS